jgi:anti-anti-sigma regulatory factor
MFRITIHDEPGLRTMRIEGRLAGPCVPEAEACWRETLAQRDNPVLRIDLTGVTMIDAAGQSFLAAVRAEGAELVASGCQMRAIVAELTREPAPERGCP